MPFIGSSHSPITPTNIRVEKFSLGQATGHLELNTIFNRSSAVPACPVTNVHGGYHQHAYGCALEHALAVMSESKLAPADAQALQRSVSWLAPNQGERFGNPVLRRITALAVMHAAVNELLNAEPSNQTLIQCEIKLRQSIVDIAVASGKCKSPPQGGDAGGSTRLVAKHLTQAGECLLECASVLDTQALAGAVVRAVLPEALAEAIGDRLGAEVEKRKAEGETSLEVIKVLNAIGAEKVRAAVQHLSCSDNFESVQNGILMMLEIPELVVGPEPGAPESKGPAKEAAPQMPAVPPELVKQANGAPIAINQNHIDFSKLAKAIGGSGLNLETLGNLLDRAREDGYRVGRVEAENERLLAVAEKQQVTIQKKNDCISRLQEELKEKNAQLSKWMNGFGNGEPGVDRGTQKDAIYGSYASTEVGKGSVVGSESAKRPPVPLVTADMRSIPSQHSDPIYDIPDSSIPDAIYANVGEHFGKGMELPRTDSVVSSAAKPLTPVFTQLQTGGIKRATGSETYSSIASSMSDPFEQNWESVDYVNTGWNRSRSSSGSSMGRGDLPPMNMLEEFEQVIKKKGPGEEYERYSYPHATVLNAKGFKEQLLSQVRSSDSDSDSVGAEQRVGFESGHSPSARLKKLFESSEQRVSMRAQRSVHTPHASNLLRSLGSAGQSGSSNGSSQLSDDGSSQVSDDVPELIRVRNGLKQRPRVYSNSLANGSEQFPKDGRRW